MDTVASLFAGNAFGTPIGQRIEKATDSAVGLSGENWALNMEICDLINGTEDGPRDAIRAVRKLFQLHTGKNPSVVLSALTVLETCVKNCGRRFHVVVCTKDFIQELVRVIAPKNDTPVEVQEKVLLLIQTWADAFQQHPDLQGVSEVYQELKLKGVEFPMTNLDTMAPIVTPHQCQPSTSTGMRKEGTNYFREVEESYITVDGEASETLASEGPAQIMLNKEQQTKLKRELEVVEGNMSVLSEMLDELVPGQEQPKDMQLFRALYVTCRTMQVRLVELLDRIANDKITARLLVLNDGLNTLFIRYEAYDKNRSESTLSSTGSTASASKYTTCKAITSKVAICRAPNLPAKTATPAAASSLIDFNNDSQSAVTSGMKNMGLKDTVEDSDFDMFAQSRTVTYETSKQSAAPYGDPDQVAASLGKVTQQRQQEGGLIGIEVFQGVKEEDIEEMEAWLERRVGEGEGDSTLSPAMTDYLSRRAVTNPTSAEQKPDEQSLNLLL